MEIKFINGPFFRRKEILLFIMRTFIFLFCTTVFSFSPGNIFSQNTKITIAADKTATIYEVFDLIREQTDYTFIYPSDLFTNSPKVQLKKGVIAANTLLEKSLSANNFSFSLASDKSIIVKPKPVSNIQQDPIRITGKVTDEDGVPLPAVAVRIAGTNLGVATDFDGNYILIVPSRESVLVFSSIGFTTKEIRVNGQTVIDVTMQEAVNQLGEVILNAGYYNVAERTKTGSIGKVDTKIIEKQPVNNPLAAIQGYLPGVNVTQTSGISGGGFEIEIRGQNSINAGNEPLFIVDGVPYGSQSLELPRISNQLIPQGNVSPLNVINPADIESIEVLKDADATAIYGSRGANGVVLITTKKGKAGKTQVNINISNSLGRVGRFLDLMNTQQYLEMRREAFANDEREPGPSDHDLNGNWDPDRFTDWQQELIGGTSFRNNAQLSVSGGSEQTRFLLSSTYLNETTVFPGDFNYNRISVHTNFNHKSLDNRLQINFSADYSVDDNQLPGDDFTLDAYRLAPNAPPLFDEDGNLNFENNTFNNPLANLERDIRVRTNNLIANAVIAYRPIPTLELKTSLGYNDIRLDSYRTDPSTAFNPAFGVGPEFSTISTNNSSRQSWIIEPQINWRQKLGEGNIDILIGGTFQEQTSDQFANLGIGFPSNSLLFDTSAASTFVILEDQNSEYNYQAFFGRINFNWKDKYILNLTGRRDGSSRFGPGNQFANFGAIGAAWLFSEEDFLNDSSFLSFGKLRGSFGTTGSDNIGDYQFLNTYITSPTFYDGTGVQPSRLFNPDFSWEENEKLELALELGFWKDRVFLSTAWYRNRSSNQLLDIPLPNTTGFSSINSNFDATVENSGLEIDFRSINIKNEKFTWSTTANLTIPRNKLLAFEGLEESTFANQLVVGEPITIVKLFQSTGLDSESGLYQFEDFNDDGVISAPDDQQFIGDTAPEFFGGIGNTLTYGDFQLDFLFQFKKQRAFNFFSLRTFPGVLLNQPVSVLDRWQEPGDDALIQRYGTGTFPGAANAFFNHASSSAAFTDASFIRLRNISLTYTLPTDFISGMGASIYLQGQNLITITDYFGADPEQLSIGSLPLLRQITLGLQLSF